MKQIKLREQTIFRSGQSLVHVVPMEFVRKHDLVAGDRLDISWDGDREMSFRVAKEKE